MPNKVLESALIKYVFTGGRKVALKYATKTENWTRPVLAQSVKDDFGNAIEKADVPAEATTAILAEKEHPSQSNGKGHFTTVYEDDNGKHVTTRHVSP